MLQQSMMLVQQPAAAGGGGTDPHWANVTLLLLGNGTNTSTAFTDSSTVANTIGINGLPTNSTDQGIEGGSSVRFNGGGLEVDSSLATSWDFAGNPFTLEAWIYGNSGGTDRHIFDAWATRFLLRHSGSTLQFFTNFSAPMFAVSQTWNTGGWHHYAVARSGNDWGIWYDGASLATTTSASSISSTPVRLRVSSSAGGDTVPGYVDGVRITKGVARYTPGVGFTPPTTFPAS